jgi:hypothetical protein
MPHLKVLKIYIFWDKKNENKIEIITHITYENMVKF